MIIDAIEAWANACVGIVVSWAATFWLLPPLFGLSPNVAQATGMTWHETLIILIAAVE
jgi:hypothetical protein